MRQVLQRVRLRHTTGKRILLCFAIKEVALNRSIAASVLDCAAKGGKDLVAKPRVLRLPYPRSPRRMRQRKPIGKIIAEVSHARSRRSRTQYVLLGIASDQQRKAHGRQQLQKLTAPQACAFPPRRGITAIEAAGIAEPHGKNCYGTLFVKLVVRQAHPLSQALAGFIRKRHPCLMGSRSWRLAGNEDRCARG
jgi:hypothetical protein